MTSPAPHPEILRIKPYIGGEATIAGVSRVIKLSSNEGAFGPPPGARAAIAAAAASAHIYPEGSSRLLREAIGERFGLDPARIVCGAGSDDLIYQLCQAYGGPGTELIMTRHGFSIYRIAGTYARCTIVEAAERARTADVDAILAAATPATRLVFLANPNNPTGTMLPVAEIDRLRAGLPDNVLLVLDAAYAEYVTRADYDAGARWVDASTNTVMTRTFSKIFGLGALRVGWTYAPPAIASVLNLIRLPFNVGTVGQQAAIAALREPGWVEQSVAHNARERARLTARLNQCGIVVGASEGNFVLADFATPARAEAADAHLRRQGLIVRPVAGYHLPSCLRLTIGTTEECDLLAAALEEFQSMPDHHIADQRVA